MPAPTPQEYTMQNTKKITATISDLRDAKQAYQTATDEYERADAMYFIELYLDYLRTNFQMSHDDIVRLVRGGKLPQRGMDA